MISWFLFIIAIIVIFFIFSLLNSFFSKVNRNFDSLKKDIYNIAKDIEDLKKIEKKEKAQEDISFLEKTNTPAFKEKINQPKIKSIEQVSPFEGFSISEKFNIPAFKEKTDNPKVENIEKKSKSTIDLEKLFGENILSKIGITTLVLGIAYFVKYAIDQNWIKETGRVGIGFIIGFIIISIAHKLRNKYLAFSSLLSGGGISVLYITTTIAFRQYEMFSQSIAFIILIIITILSVTLALYYNKQILAIFSILGGFASPLLVSTGSGNYITLFSYILILNTGMLLLAYKKKWVIVNMLSYIFTYGFYFSWLFFSYKIVDKGGTIIFGALFFAQFYILVLIEYLRKRKISSYQVFIILSNNFLLYIALFYIFRNSSNLDIYKLGNNGIRCIITLTMAVANIIPMLLLFKKIGKDSLFFHLLLGIVITYISLAIPIQLRGSAITMFWGAEAVLLLWLLKKTKIEIFKFSFLILQILALISLIMDYEIYYLTNKYSLPIIFNPIFITGTSVIIYLSLSVFLLKNENDSLISVFSQKIGTLHGLQQLLYIILLILVFIFPFTELTYQLIEKKYNLYEIALLQGVYIYLFLAGFIIIKKYYTKKIVYYTSLTLSILYPIFYLRYIIFSLISERFHNTNFSYTIFLFHLATLPAFILLQKYLYKKNTSENKELIYWIISIVSIMTISFEIDNIILCFYPINILGNIHTVVYPVVWGILALILIIIGMKKKIYILRKISLALFALIILKLYLYDVWKMPQTGKIIAFIILGLVLLGTSFLYQKLKNLITEKEDNEEEDINT